MTVRDWIAVGGIIFALVGAGVSYGRMASALDDAQKEIALLRADMSAINAHFIMWASAHKEN